MIILNKTAQQAFEPMKKLDFEAFRDAGKGICTYKCTVLDCLRGLEYAMRLGWFDFNKFDNNQYEHFENIDNGDLNWIIPGKMVAFSSPSDQK